MTQTRYAVSTGRQPATGFPLRATPAFGARRPCRPLPAGGTTRRLRPESRRAARCGDPRRHRLPLGHLPSGNFPTSDASLSSAVPSSPDCSPTAPSERCHLAGPVLRAAAPCGCCQACSWSSPAVCSSAAGPGSTASAQPLGCGPYQSSPTAPTSVPSTSRRCPSWRRLSLAVEEQFYVLWRVPFVLLVARVAHRRPGHDLTHPGGRFRPLVRVPLPARRRPGAALGLTPTPMGWAFSSGVPWRWPPVPDRGGHRPRFSGSCGRAHTSPSSSSSSTSGCCSTTGASPSSAATSSSRS